MQMVFLQLTSSKATQNITIHCKNIISFFDKEKKNHDLASTFLSSNDQEYSPRNILYNYNVNLDDCREKDDKWRKTIFEFNTKKTRRLPIVDISLSDFGGDDQQFYVEIGPVCFS